MYSLTTDARRVREFMNSISRFDPCSDATAIGLEFNAELVAGVSYERMNRFNAWIHMASKPGARITRTYLLNVFHYPFVQCGVERLSGYVDDSNTAAKRLDEHLGFKREAVLRGAAQDGGDVLIYVMRRSDCRFLKE